jgi:hypothetical protein|tara:strand:- start:27072 stop:27239 length:168 start_codon:yes stop_codon:yes gene_type:complete
MLLVVPVSIGYGGAARVCALDLAVLPETKDNECDAASFAARIMLGVVVRVVSRRR